MAVRLVKGKVINVFPPARLDKEARKNIASIKTDQKIIDMALKSTRNIKIVRRNVRGL